LYSLVPSVTSTTRPPGDLMSSGSAKWLVIAYLVGDEMIDLDRDSVAASLVHESRGLLDGLRPIHLRPLRPGGPSRDINRRTGRAELHRDAPAGTTCGSRDQCDLPRQRRLHRVDFIDPAGADPTFQGL
jgi:hypothetical protein